MKMTDVKKKATTLGIQSGKMKKTDLVRTIQAKEGNSPCFQTGLDSCDQFDCCWRSDCLPATSTGKIELNKRESYLNKIKADLEEFKDNIDDLKEKTKRMVGKSKAEVLEEIKRLEKKSEEEIKQKTHALAEAGEDVWEKTKKGIDNSWEDLSKTFKKLVSKFGSRA